MSIKKDTIFREMSLSAQNKKILIGLVLLLIVIISFLSAYLFLFNDESSYVVSGMIYINNEVAPLGVGVKLVFPSGEVNDSDGTDAFGNFSVDVSNFVDESGVFIITYMENTYPGKDAMGLLLNLTVNDSNINNVDVYISVQEGDDESYEDADGDGVVDDEDNCPDSANPDQTDSDGDGIGDACDDFIDTDGDGVVDDEDNCPNLYNPDQNDDDNDGIGDVCDDFIDTDGDGVADDEDNCPDSANPDQTDTDGDGIGDACDDIDDGGGDNGGDSDDNDDDDGEGDDDQENESSHILVVEKTVWDDEINDWVDSVGVELDEEVLFNISIFFNESSNLSKLLVKDQLPRNISFPINATVNGITNLPEIDALNHTLIWNISSLNNTDSMYVEYNCSVEKIQNFTNLVNVSGRTQDNNTLFAEDMANVQIYGSLLLNTTIWDNATSNWEKNVTMSSGEKIVFNITVAYEGCFNVKDVLLLDLLPENISFLGNSTTNGMMTNPVIDGINNSVSWNIDIDQFNPCYIVFEAIASENASFINKVILTGNESTGKQYLIQDNAKVTILGFQQISCSKLVRSNTLSWQNEIDAYVNDQASFNITFTNTGNTTLYNLNIYDSLPLSLEYVEGSSTLYFKNSSYNAEPYTTEGQHFLLWSNLNEVIHDYLDPNETISILFNVTILDEGIIINTVNITSTLCNHCDPLIASAQAVINATIRILPLSVDTGGPYFDYIDQLNQYTASASGGTPPYNFSWDLDDDGEFDDGSGSTVSKTWTQEGNYTICVKVVDQQNDSIVNSTFVNVTIQPLMVDAGGPYEAFAGDNVSFIGTATGGLGNYTWQWDFGDGNTSVERYPNHTYMMVDKYLVNLTVTDEENRTENDTAQVTILERDTIPPIASIEKPINAIYINDNPIFPFFRPLIFGNVNISVLAYDLDSSVDYIELFVNEELVETFYDESGNWTWDERIFGRQTITVKAFDVAGNYHELDEVIWKFF